jgi:hypothetical protein
MSIAMAILRLLTASLLAMGASASARADQIAFPEIYDGPLLLLTPASQDSDGVPEGLAKEVLPEAKVVLSAHGFHAFLTEKRSTCFEKGCTAILVAPVGAVRSVSPEVHIDGGTTIRFNESADDTDECNQGRAFFEGINIYVRAWPTRVRASLGTAVRCRGERADVSNSDRNRVAYVWMMSEESAGTGISSDGNIKYQIGQQTLVVTRSEILRRILREEDAE